MLDQQVVLRPSQVRKARQAVRARLSELGHDPQHITAVEAVVAELLGAAAETGATTTVELSVSVFPLLTSVRLRCPPRLDWHDDPFGLRERVLKRLTVASGQRRNEDSTIDLWAEVPRNIAHSVQL